MRTNLGTCAWVLNAIRKGPISPTRVVTEDLFMGLPNGLEMSRPASAWNLS